MACLLGNRCILCKVYARCPPGSSRSKESFRPLQPHLPQNIHPVVSDFPAVQKNICLPNAAVHFPHAEQNTGIPKAVFRVSTSACVHVRVQVASCIRGRLLQMLVTFFLAPFTFCSSLTRDDRFPPLQRKLLERDLC